MQQVEAAFNPAADDKDGSSLAAMAVSYRCPLQCCSNLFFDDRALAETHYNDCPEGLVACAKCGEAYARKNLESHDCVDVRLNKQIKVNREKGEEIDRLKKINNETNLQIGE